MSRALAALNLPRRIPDLIMYARSIATAMQTDLLCLHTYVQDVADKGT